jgi:excisionase family DNA binding protein
MDSILKEILRKKALLNSLRPFPKSVEENMNDWFRVELTYTSNAIEGNTLTRQETALIVEKGVTVEGKSVHEHLEALNHAEAYTYIHALAQNKRIESLTMQDILDIHRIILKNINNTDAGRLRSTAVRISGSTTILPNPVKVPELMEDFIYWLNTTKENPVSVAVDTHFRLVSIHPFVDGNGRTARLLMNLILIHSGFPPAIIRKEERNRYLTALEIAQTRGAMDAYYELMYDAVDRSLDIYLDTLQPSPQVSPAIPLNTLYTTDEIAAMLHVDVESVRRYVRSGKLKAVKLGGKLIRIEKKDFDLFIQQHKTT